VRPPQYVELAVEAQAAGQVVDQFRLGLGYPQQYQPVAGRGLFAGEGRHVGSPWIR
jgi:hypothetical protein